MLLVKYIKQIGQVNLYLAMAARSFLSYVPLVLLLVNSNSRYTPFNSFGISTTKNYNINNLTLNKLFVEL